MSEMKTRDVVFYSRGSKLSGTVYLPDNYKEGEKLPCIIPNSGITGVMAVYPTLMARLFTKHGYACLGFDFRGWMKSEGDVHATNFSSEYEDIEAAYTFARLQPEIDPENIGLFCWGFSGPIGIRFAIDNWKIKCVAVGNSFANGYRAYTSTLSFDEVLKRQEGAEKDRIQRVLTGKGELHDLYFFNQPEDDHNAGKSDYIDGTINNLAPGLADEIAAIYGGIENFPPLMPWTWWEDHMRINAEEYVGQLAPRGLFILTGDKDVGYGAMYESEQLYKQAGAGAQLFTVHGSHNDWMYDDHPEFIKAGAALVKFYDSYMK